MIGHQLYRYLKTDKHYDLSIQHNQNKFFQHSYPLDFFDLDGLQSFILREKPDSIINCTGVLIEQSNQDFRQAIYLNSYIPHFLKDLINSIGGKFIQISTDCVFSGDTGPYAEYDLKDGLSNYSKTKGLGEIDDDINLTLRTSVIGPDLKASSTELLHWFLLQDGEIQGFSKSLWTGITSYAFAKIVKKFLDSQISGIYNISSPKAISKYELLMLLENRFQRGLKISKVDGPLSNKSLLDTRRLLDLDIPSYEDMIDELYESTAGSAENYKHYFSI